MSIFFECLLIVNFFTYNHVTIGIICLKDTGVCINNLLI